MDIHASLDKILASKTTFAESFYRRLEQEHPDVFAHFQGVDMRYQLNLLTMALIVIEKEYRSPNDAIKSDLRVLGTKHSRKQISREEFTRWTESMLNALAEHHGADWDDELCKDWHDAITIAIDQMLVGYDEHYHV